MINRFTNEYFFLSNFYNIKISVEGLVYPSVEHAFQALKTNDLHDRKKIRQAKSAGEAKKLGRKVKMRSDWESVKIGVMEDLLRIKFSSKDLKEKLLATDEEELIEGNDWNDNFWGSCNCVKCKGNKGKNHLGKLIMKIRKELGKDK